MSISGSNQLCLRHSRGQHAEGGDGDADGRGASFKSSSEGATFTLDAADGDAPILNYADLAKTFDELGAGDTLKGVILCTAAQANIASTMAKGSAKACSLILAVLDKEGTDTIPGKVGLGRRA